MKTDEYREITNNMAMLEVALDIQQHYAEHKKGVARRVVEKEYTLRRADLTEWMQNRQDTMNELLAGGDPEFAAAMTNLLFPMPLTAMMTMAGQQAPQQKGEGKEANKSDSDKKPAMPNGDSPNQGVSKEEQQNG